MHYKVIASRIRELKKIFNQVDDDGNGYITLDEARQALQEERNLSQDEIENLLRLFDADGNGTLEFDEFVKLWNARFAE